MKNNFNASQSSSTELVNLSVFDAAYQTPFWRRQSFLVR